MTEFEYEDDDLYEDEPGDLELREQIDEVQGMLEAQQEVEAVNQEIRRLEAAHGSGFTEAEVQGIGALIDEGYSAEDAYAAVEPETEEVRALYREVDRREQKEGRELVQSEWDAISRDGEEAKLLDLGDGPQRRQYAAELLGEQFEQPETPEVVERPADDASADERKQFMRDRLEGAEVSDWPYQSPASESGVDYE